MERHVYIHGVNIVMLLFSNVNNETKLNCDYMSQYFYKIETNNPSQYNLACV